MKHVLAGVLGLLFAFSASGQVRNAENYSRLLLPFVTTPASDGGMWSVQWWFRNDGAAAIDAFPLAFGCGFCPREFMDHAWIVPAPALPAKSTLEAPCCDVFPAVPVPPFIPVARRLPGTFIYIEKNRELAVSGHLRWADLNSQSQPTQLRAIKESEFVSGTHSVIAVPLRENLRYDVRVYALPETSGSASVTLNVYDMRSFRREPVDPLLKTMIRPLVNEKGSRRPCLNVCDFPDVEYTPAVAEVLDIAEGIQPFADVTLLRVEIEPSSPNVRYWAVVSVTSPDREVQLFELSP